MPSLAEYALVGDDGKPYAPSAVCYAHDSASRRAYAPIAFQAAPIDWERSWRQCHDEELPCIVCQNQEADCKAS